MGTPSTEDGKLPSDAEIAMAIRVLETITASKTTFDRPLRDQSKEMKRLHHACGALSSKSVERRFNERQRLKDMRKAQRHALFERTGIRQARQERKRRTKFMFSAAPQAAILEKSCSVEPAEKVLDQSESSEEKNEATSSLIGQLKCHICRASYSKLHHFYDRLCEACGDLNFAKRHQTVDLSGQIAIVTGGRIKIGKECALMLLRAGATVIVTTRFANDCLIRYRAEDDYEQFRDRLHVYALDLRQLKMVEDFAAHVNAKYDRLDILIQNAAQTIRRPPKFYQHLIEGETSASLAITDGQQNGISIFQTSHQVALLSQVPLIPEDGESSDAVFPIGQFDEHHQQVDLRPTNSWTAQVGDVSTIECLETHVVNAVAPFVLFSQLAPLMLKGRKGGEKATPSRHVINVSSMEGKFARHKSTAHPHTNMAKASLNMLTRTSAAQFEPYGVYVNSVDTGWVSDENPWNAQRTFHPPLDEIDGAARVLDPVFMAAKSEVRYSGLFLKDYHSTSW